MLGFFVFRSSLFFVTMNTITRCSALQKLHGMAFMIDLCSYDAFFMLEHSRFHPSGGDPDAFLESALCNFTVQPVAEIRVSSRSHHASPCFASFPAHQRYYPSQESAKFSGFKHMGTGD